MIGHSMKRGFGAIVMTTAMLASAALPAWAQAQGQTAAPPTLDERLGCGMMFLSVDEMVRTFPALGQGFGGSNREGATALLRVMAVSGGQAYNGAFNEAVAQGASPADVHRRSIAFIGQRFQGVKNLKSSDNKELMGALFNRCSTVVAATAK